MRLGDTLRWQGVNGFCQGTLTESENGELLVMTDEGKSLPLEHLLGSKKIRVYESE